ncbi:MAG: 3-phosphoshikimate 1-carboxyvinyltransferase [Phycisphaera sp.]|nr:3-phosphoshikimate 1-carboxyvinyltransferase [Phycisphaera sp.]
MNDPLPITPLGGPFDLTIDDLPGSKSLTNRALLLAALAEGTSTLTNVLFADDTRVMMAALGKLGFDLNVDEPKRTVTITGGGGAFPAGSADLVLGNAGTAVRFLTAACCIGRGFYTLDGIARMRERPIGQLVAPLRELGADITYLDKDGYLPLRINAGGLTGGAVAMPPTLSSQYISALLQIGPCLDKGVMLAFDAPIISRPYVDMTLRLMDVFRPGVDALEIEKTPTADGEMETVRVPTGGYVATDYRVEPDASNASYFLAAAAITPMATCRISGLGRSSVQGDAAFAHVLGRMGATVEQRDDSTWIKGPHRLRGVDVDLNEMPDMAQTLAVVAMFAEGPTVIRNVGNLRVKETDRLAALHAELTKLGGEVEVSGDDIRVENPTPGGLRPADIDTYDDHRMAMSFAIAGLACDGVRINDPACVNKTFPAYWDFLGRLHAAATSVAEDG